VISDQSSVISKLILSVRRVVHQPLITDN